ncbi:hypothetical protein ACFL56_01720 [Candidatus Margulisiibacteriota bacterium]
MTRKKTESTLQRMTLFIFYMLPIVVLACLMGLKLYDQSRNIDELVSLTKLEKQIQTINNENQYLEVQIARHEDINRIEQIIKNTGKYIEPKIIYIEP